MENRKSKKREWKLNQITQTNQCTNCGICTLVCPNNKIIQEDKSSLIKPCLRKGNGNCYDVCPRISINSYQIKIREQLNSKQYITNNTKKESLKTIIKTLLNTDKIDAIIKIENDHWNQIKVITKEENQYKIEKLNTINQIKKLDLNTIAVIALSCQINALRNIQYFSNLKGHKLKENEKEKIPEIKYLIGQYCMGIYNKKDLKQLLKKEDIDKDTIENIHTTKTELIIKTKDTTCKLPLPEIGINPGCNLCDDYESKQADMSIGTINNKTSIILRTAKVQKFKEILQLKEDNENLIKQEKQDKKYKFEKTISERQETNEQISPYWIASTPGVVKQADENYFIRIRSKQAGWYTPNEIKNISEIAMKNNSRIKITTRGLFELHDINPLKIMDVIHELDEKDLKTGSEGPLVRGTIACPGQNNCKKALINTENLRQEISNKFEEQPTPYKFKIAISGCPNKCVRPQIHDFGIVGVTYPEIDPKKCCKCGRCQDVCKIEAINDKIEINESCIGCGMCIKACPHNAIKIRNSGYELFIGGKSGRELVEGIKIYVDSQEEIVPLIEKTINLYIDLAKKPQKERLATTIKNYGRKNFINRLC
ncbi:MAG: Coenzyme F420 hydrogenase/dehydrogenase, beta subunit C-terminal domain [Methanobacteriaceae archaeon]|nr:Coenzyme F420 hydrogenase/dehydrogenase, beta subunit C-terminal domain [Methanobacteriaceae archaeon]